MLSYQRFLSFSYFSFWNRWWSLQSDWLSAVWFIYESHNHICSKSRYLCSKPRRTVAPCFLWYHFCFEYKMRCNLSRSPSWKALLFPLFNRLFDLPTGTSLLMVLDLRYASWPLRKSCHPSLYPAFPLEVFQVVSFLVFFPQWLMGYDHHVVGFDQARLSVFCW